MSRRRSLPLAAAIGLWAPAAVAQTLLPDGFVRLRDIAPTIRQDMRYAGPFNFTGKPVPGYEAPVCILRREAAEALQKAQAEFAPLGLSIKVFDCYRPTRAVDAFAAWSKGKDGDDMKGVFYPGLDRGRLFALGYIASRSSHSKGVAVDLGLVRADEPEAAAQGGPTSGRCDEAINGRVAETTVDLGTAYDCFSEKSATAFANIPSVAKANRRLLVDVMRRAGFVNYAKEWWHFQLVPEPKGLKPADFPVR